LDAIDRVVNMVREATAGKRWKRGSKYCLVVALNIKNAFNTDGWNNICLALNGLEVSEYLKKMVKNYFSNRSLRYDTEDGPEEYKLQEVYSKARYLDLCCGGPSHHVRRTTEIGITTGSGTNRLCDDAMLVITKLLKIQRIFGDSYDKIQQWMSSAGLQLAEHKMEAITMLITSRRKTETITLTVEEHHHFPNSHQVLEGDVGCKIEFQAASGICYGEGSQGGSGAGKTHAECGP